MRRRPSKTEPRCSFCARSAGQVDKIITGPSVHICNECVKLCNEVLIEEKQRARDTIQLAVNALCADGRVGEGDTIVSMTGSPLAISGATSAIRLIQIGENGDLADFD